MQRWSIPAGTAASDLRRLLARTHPGTVPHIGVARFNEDDGRLRDRIARELAGADPVGTPLLRAMLVHTGGQTELMVAGSGDGRRSHEAAPHGSGGAARPRDQLANRNSLEVLRPASRPRVHLFHPGGGGTAAYRLLAASLPDSWTVTASDDIGRGDSVAALAELYLRPLLLAQGIPDIVGGWSLGGLIGFHTAQLLSTAGRRPPAVVLLDAPPPGSAGPMPSQPRLNLELAGALWTALGRTSFCPVEIDTADDSTTARVMAAALWRVGETFDVALLEEQLDTYRRHRRALVDFAVTEPLAARALLIAAALSDDEVRAWRQLFTAEPVVARLAGGHYDLLRPDGAHRVAQLLTRLTL